MTQRTDLRITGGTLLLNDGTGRVLDRGELYIAGSTIAAVGSGAERLEADYAADTALDATGMLVMPGLVNAHYHSSDALVRGAAPGMPLEVWSPFTDAGRLDRTPREVYVSAQLGALEALASGTTAVLDHLRLSPALTEDGLDAAARAHLDAGVRTAVAPVLSDLPVAETIPIELAELPPHLAQAATATRQPPGEQLGVCAAFLARWAGRDLRVRVLVGPSAPQRCSDALLESCAALAARYGTGMHLHVLETRVQRYTCQRRYAGRTIEHLAALGVLGPRTSLVHAVWATDDDLDVIASTGTTVVHCPTANLRLGSGIARVPEMLRRGVRVALGTDGPGCNDSLNMVTVMKAAGLIHTLASADHTTWPAPDALLRMATHDAAAVLGYGGQVGALRAGQLADIVLVPLDQPAFAPRPDPTGQLVYASEGARVDTVIVGGEVVLRGGRSTRVDERALYAEARTLAASLWTRNAAAYARARELAPYLAVMVRRVACDGSA